jgi:hypothetical protein
MSAPPPPHSLAPVAMAAHARNTANTGPRAAETIMIRSRPNIRWGMMLLVAGMLVGSTLGVSMRMRDQAMHAQAVASEHDAQVAATQFSMPIAYAGNQANSSPVSAPPSASTPAPVAAPTTAVIPPQPGVLVSAAPAAKPETKDTKSDAKGDKADKADKADKDREPSSKRVAVAHAKAPPPAPEPASKVNVSAKVSAPPPPPPAKEPEKTAKAQPRANDDAQKLLQAAMKDTTNTL